jgi:peptidoglycan/LPS O-acetylase OafA/YrhL
MKNEPLHIKYLDGWRGIAILFVLLSHFFHINFMDLGRLGVDIFFVLSGTLMGNILFIKKVDLKTFYIRRFSRVIPVFFVFVAALFCIYWLLGDATPVSHIFPTLFFIRTYFPSEISISQSSIPIGHLWSLNVEEHAYVIMSIVTLFAFKAKKSSINLIGLAVLSQIVFFLYSSDILTSPSNAAIRTEVAISFIFYAAGYRVFLESNNVKVNPILPLVTFVFSIICYLNIMPWWSSFFPPILLAFTINHLKDTSNAIQKLLSFRLLTQLGLYSFSIYLWQQPLYKIQDNLPAGSALLLAIIVGIISYHVIENPMRKLINKRWAPDNKINNAKSSLIL